MDASKQELVDMIIRNFETTYTKFLEIEALPDNAVNKIAFYAIAESMVYQDPIPDEDIQAAALHHMASVKHQGIETVFDDFQAMFLTIAEVDVAELIMKSK